MAQVKPIPDGYTPVTPYLIVDGAVAAIDFYKAAFGAEEIMRMPKPDGTLGHAELRIGASVIMLADESPGIEAFAPKKWGGSPITLMLYIEDVDGVVAKAAALGATVTRPVADQFYGDRTAGITDPFGHKWYLATHVEDVPPEEMERRAAAAFGG
jgi:PhnB protein